MDSALRSLLLLFLLAAQAAGAAIMPNIFGRVQSSSYVPKLTLIQANIASTQAAWAATANRSGTVHYYCDCGTGAEGDCVAGSNSNSGLTTSVPKQTIADAASTFTSMAEQDTVALCKGGAFNVGATLNLGLTCSGTAPCKDLREFTPTTFTGTAKPILNWTATNSFLFDFGYVSSPGDGGVRIINLKLQGNNGTGNDAFAFYDGASGVTVGNVDIDSFQIGVYNESNAANNSYIILTGNNFNNSASFAFLGSSDNSSLSYNNFTDNGASNDLDHAVYFSKSYTPIQNLDFIGNYITGQYGSGACLGSQVEGHFAVNGFNVKDNYLGTADAKWGASNFGMEFNNETDDPSIVYNRNAVFSGNIIVNAGNTAFNVTGCSSCTIENNLIVFTATTNANNHYGMRFPIAVKRASYADDVNSGNIIRNNTVYFGTAWNENSIGISVGLEGTGYTISNNSVTFAASSGALWCYDYGLSASSYAAYSFIDNNHCYSASSMAWEYNTGDSITAWRAATVFDDNSTTSAPSFANVGTLDFRPSTGSPLIAAGSNTHKSATDIVGTSRPNPPAVGAFEP
jgi:hypothetical protein